MKTANKIMMPNGDLIALSGASFEMFDTKLLDHILTYEQTKGWALQGTYVYKEAVAGSRYGYPDFYNKCLEEKDLGIATETVLGENTITLYVNANGHTFYDIADKEAIDAWYNTYGIAWYYGVDTDNECVFLPRTKWFIQPTGEITEVNTVNEAGLPNITGRYSRLRHNAPGAKGEVTGAIFTQNSTQKEATLNLTTVSDTNAGLGFDASLSNPIYGNSDTVQPPSINQLLYICVGNTNIESAVTDVVDVTTTENDTMPLGYSTYQNGIVPNTSWLKSQGQWNDGNVYTTFYNEFVQKIGQSFASGYVKEITEEYDDYDLVINQTDMTFRLPLLDGSEDLASNNYINYDLPSTSGQTYTALYNGFVKVYATTTGANQYIRVTNITTDLLDEKRPPINGVGNVVSVWVNKGDTFSITGDVVSSVDVVLLNKAKGNGSLYFKVANAVQNLELLDAGEVLEVLSTKTDKLQACEASFPSNKYIDLTLNASGSTYTAPANGWYYVGKNTSSSGQYVEINNETKHYTDRKFGTGGTIILFTPVSKGDVIKVKYNAGGATDGFRFIYAQGEV